MIDDLLAKLNGEQQQAVTHIEGPLMIVAGAGTGKTTVVTHRIAWLIDQGHAKPEEILALTFTDKAAGRWRNESIGYSLWLCRSSDLDLPLVCRETLRQYGAELGLSRFQTHDRAGCVALARQHFDRFELDYYRPLGNPTKYYSLVAHALLASKGRGNRP